MGTIELPATDRRHEAPWVEIGRKVISKRGHETTQPKRPAEIDGLLCWHRRRNASAAAPVIF